MRITADVVLVRWWSLWLVWLGWLVDGCPTPPSTPAPRLIMPSIPPPPPHHPTQHARAFINPVKERELDLRGLKIPLIENLGVTQDQFDSIDLCDK